MIKKHLTKNPFHLENLNIKYRKLFHYTLLVCVIFLQVIIVVIWYNETTNEVKQAQTIDNISSTGKISQYTNKINNSFLNSQFFFNNYVIYKDEVSLEKYLTSLDDINFLIDSLNFTAENNKMFKKVLIKQKNTTVDIVTLKSSIDSIINRQINVKHNDVSKLFKFKDFNFKKILDSVKSDTYIKIDTLSKKGLISRLGDAFMGKYRVQKEQVNTVVTMKFNDKITSGSIECA